MPAVQHARPAAGPAGRRHGPPRARSAAVTWRGEPGVAVTPAFCHSTQQTLTFLKVHFGLSVRRDWKIKLELLHMEKKHQKL